MLDAIITQIAVKIGASEETAAKALGIVMNAAERQGAPLAEAIYAVLPGARILAANTGDAINAPTGAIARLIEQTPGGRRHVAIAMISSLHAIGLDHKAIGQLLPAIAEHMQSEHGLSGFGHLGDLIGSDLDAAVAAAEKAA